MDPFVISSVPQATAFFTGYTDDEQRQKILSLYPESFPNRHLDSLDNSEAHSFTGTEAEFRTSDFQKAHQQYLGYIKYPFHSIADIENHTFDPSYFDGSEERPLSINVQENLIGTPLGATVLEDPRLTYIDSLLKVKEYHAGNMPLDDSYIRNLYMLQTEKGVNYYFNQLNEINEALGKHTREGYNEKNAEDVHPFHYTRLGGQGSLNHERPELSTREMTQYSITPNVQQNYRRELMDQKDRQLKFMNEEYFPKKRENRKRPITHTEEKKSIFEGISNIAVEELKRRAVNGVIDAGMSILG